MNGGWGSALSSRSRHHALSHPASSDSCLDIGVEGIRCPSELLADGLPGHRPFLMKQSYQPAHLPDVAPRPSRRRQWHRRRWRRVSGWLVIGVELCLRAPHNASEPVPTALSVSLADGKPLEYGEYVIVRGLHPKQ